jgi:hypothetical protein
MLSALARNRMPGYHFPVMSRDATGRASARTILTLSWFISPGQGRAFRIRARHFHEDRSFAAVRTTEIRNADGTRLLERVSHHAA